MNNTLRLSLSIALTFAYAPVWAQVVPATKSTAKQVFVSVSENTTKSVSKSVSEEVLSTPAKTHKAAALRDGSRTNLNASGHGMTHVQAMQIDQLMRESDNKSLLRLHQQYIDEAQAIKPTLRKIVQLSASGNVHEQRQLQVDLVGELIPQAVKNRTLARLVTEAVLKENRKISLKTALQELADYYSLPVDVNASLKKKNLTFKDKSDVFVSCAVDYLRRNPQKVNLRLREILKSGVLPDNLRYQIQSYINQHALTVSDAAQLTKLITQAETLFQRRIALAEASPEVRSTLATHAALLEELQTFTAKYNRAPRWNGPIEERGLFNRLEIVRNSKTHQGFPQVVILRSQIERELNRFPKRSDDVVLKEAEEFIHKHRFSPRQYDPRLRQSDQELQLYEELVQIQISSSSSK